MNHGISSLQRKLFAGMSDQPISTKDLRYLLDDESISSNTVWWAIKHLCDLGHVKMTKRKLKQRPGMKAKAKRYEYFVTRISQSLPEPQEGPARPKQPLPKYMPKGSPEPGHCPLTQALLTRPWVPDPMQLGWWAEVQ